jgi:hypothetical protein
MWASDGCRAPSKELYAGSNADDGACVGGRPSGWLTLMTLIMHAKRQKQFFLKKSYPVVVTNEESVFGIIIFQKALVLYVAEHGLN